MTLTLRQQNALDLVKQLHGQWDVALLMGFIEHESSFNPAAFLNDKNGGSYGLFQLNLQTAEDRGFTGTALELYYPPTNINFAVKHLDWIKDYLTKHECYSEENLVAAYNEGAHGVVLGRKVPFYVTAVLAAKARWEVILSPKETENDSTSA